MFGANNPYLRPIWVTVARTPVVPVRSGEAYMIDNSIPRPSSSTTDTEGLSVYFTLDDSGSMSSSRLNAMKAAVKGTLDVLIQRVNDGGRVDVGWAGLNRGRRETTNCTIADLEGFKSLTDSVYASGDTPFDTTAQWVLDWFEASKNDIGIEGRAHFIMSDGAATGDSDDVAAGILAPLLNRTIDVDMWGVAMDTSANVANLEKLHNMPNPVPVVDTSNVDDFTKLLEDALPIPRDANPIAVIAECYINKEWGMGTDPDNIDWNAFWTARDIVRDEELGVFLTWQASTSIESFIDDILKLVKGAVFVDPSTGKLTIRLLRADNGYPPTGKTITEDNAVLDSFSRKGWGEITNEIVVTWTNPANEKEETVTVQNLPGITRQGAVISTGFNAYGLRTRSSAIRVANRELAQEAVPLISCEATTNREFWDVKPYETVDLSWPEYGIDSLRMRVMKVDYGDSKSSKIKLSLIEDVYSRESAQFLESQSTRSISRPVDPAPVSDPRIIEVPAYFASRAGVNVAAADFPDTGATVLATAPDRTSSSFELQGEVVLANGSTEWQELGGAQSFVGSGTLPTGLSREVTTTALTLDQADVGFAPNQVLVIGEPTASEETLELALVTAIDGNGAATLRRGVLDTVPTNWPAGTPVWVTTPQDWAPIPATLADGQTIRLRLLTQATGVRLEPEDAPVETEVLTSRVTRPLRPANLRVSGLLWPSVATDLDWPVTLTWSHRNRLLEDTVMLAWDDPSAPVEQGVEYQLTVEGLDSAGNVLGVADSAVLDASVADSYALSSDLLIPETFQGVDTVRVTMTAQLDGLDAWQDTTTLFKALRMNKPVDFDGFYVPDVYKPNGLRGDYESDLLRAPNGLPGGFFRAGYGNDYGNDYGGGY
jgi:uncharacterized protein YegL